MSPTLVPNFLPSKSGFHFPNCFPAVPVKTISIPWVGDIPIGNAAGGLCGGMVFAVRDFFSAKQPIPASTDPPEAGTPLFNFLVDRLLDSFNMLSSVAKYYQWMQFPDQSNSLVRSVQQRTVQDEWPDIQADLDAGILSPLGLVTVRSINPKNLKLNHQVLAYGYTVADDGVTVTIRIYDPDHPNNDSTHLLLNIGDTPSVSYPGVRQVRAFFRTSYSPPSRLPT